MTDRLCQQCGEAPSASPNAAYCRPCRKKRYRLARKKYWWTPERDQLLRDRYDGRVYGRVDEIADELGFPDWCVKKRAAALGLTREAKRRRWTEAEERLLEELAGEVCVEVMARHLRRSVSSVTLKLKRERLERQVAGDGIYTGGQLAEAFGVDLHVISRWIAEGKLRAHRRGADAKDLEAMAAPQQIPWHIRQEDVLRFVVRHPMAFRLDKVDQRWFMDLVAVPAQEQLVEHRQCSVCTREDPHLQLLTRPTGEGGEDEDYLVCRRCHGLLSDLQERETA